MFKTKNPALIVIDCQKAIDEFSTMSRSNLDAESEISKLLFLWRSNNKPIIHIRHSSKSIKSPYHASKPTFEFKDEVKPQETETVLTKSENCAFVGTNLEEKLNALNVKELVICGVLTHHSVDATIRYACALGYEVTVAANTTASFSIVTRKGHEIDADTMQDIFLSNLDNEYCRVVEGIKTI